MSEYKYLSTKTFGHNLGISTAFRQWRATHSHCSFIHGYALEVTMIFGTDQLDDKNWCVDFGGLKEIKKWLEDSFDHKMVVAKDDPELAWFEEGAQKGVLDLVIVDNVGCEKFAELIANKVEDWLYEKDTECTQRVSLVSVEVREHGANSAIFYPRNH